MSNDHQNGKGSKRRPGSLKAYEDGWDRIFGKSKEVVYDKNPVRSQSRSIKRLKLTPMCCSCKFWTANSEGSFAGKCSGNSEDKNYTSAWDFLCDNFKNKKK